MRKENKKRKMGALLNEPYIFTIMHLKYGLPKASILTLDFITQLGVGPTIFLCFLPINFNTLFIYINIYSFMVVSTSFVQNLIIII